MVRPQIILKRGRNRRFEPFDRFSHISRAPRADHTRVMAKQYFEAVGPWEAYLPVLHR